MPAKAYPGFEEISMALDFLGPLRQCALAFNCLKGLHRVRGESLIRQDQQQLIFLQGVDLRNLADIKHSPRFRGLVLRPTL